MARKQIILFVCTGNACRSQMAEALLRHLGGDRFEPMSAGTFPAGFIHPLAVEAMRRMGVPLVNQSSKSLDDVLQEPVDVVITVCDDAAKEACSRLEGKKLTAHWSLPDPVYHLGTDEERIDFALRTAKRLEAKITGLLSIDWSAAPEQIKKRLDFLGEI